MTPILVMAFRSPAKNNSARMCGLTPFLPLSCPFPLRPLSPDPFPLHLHHLRLVAKIVDCRPMAEG